MNKSEKRIIYVHNFLGVADAENSSLMGNLFPFLRNFSLKQQNTHGQIILVQCISVKVWIRSRKWNRFILEMFNGDVLLFAFDIKIDMGDN